MTSMPPQPVADSAQALAPSSLSMSPPPRTSSREASLTDGLMRGKDGHPPNGLAVPAQPGGAQDTSEGASDETTNETLADTGRSSKRSLTGRRRDVSIGSRRSARAAASANEKGHLPVTADLSQSAMQPKPKKKGGLLSFLSCCAAPDESSDSTQTESAQPIKPSVKAQPTRAQQPAQSRPLQNTSSPDATTEVPMEVLNEKTAAHDPSDPFNGNSAVAHDSGSEKAAVAGLAVVGGGAAIGGTAVAHLPSDSTPGHFGVNSTGEMQQNPSSTDTTAVPPVDTNYNTTNAGSSSTNPQVMVEAPTPVVAQAENEDAIHDRTAVQEKRDNDIEMTDAGVTVPLTEAEAQSEVERERLENESSRQTHDPSIVSHTTLPPPPPLPDTMTHQTDSRDSSPHPINDGASISTQKWLLPPVRPEFKGRKCLVLDLDETLVHSSFKILHHADFTIPVEIEGQYHNVYVIKRPGVDAFMKRVGELYEVVVFTASVSKYGDPLLDQLDIHNVVHHRLFRESCYNHQGNYVKDLSQVGRDLRETIIIDNSPTSYIFHPQHAVPISSWFSDAHDNELLDLIPVLEDLAHEQVSDVSLVLDVAL
ncbi:Hypothetical protein R9X50_00575800 [Acrodontium crateriforme]|uniref:FCP1 homology domain-containing protein n=1 Tax=Acrodontium crateriforme TaxID=150365 RepID=A0AAQ3M7T4_9PEZI|nr:Hypothetical protein R9X50_00575800 [Acrodontium crateriforme]